MTPSGVTAMTPSAIETPSVTAMTPSGATAMTPSGVTAMTPSATAKPPLSGYRKDATQRLPQRRHSAVTAMTPWRQGLVDPHAIVLRSRTPPNSIERDHEWVFIAHAPNSIGCDHECLLRARCRTR